MQEQLYPVASRELAQQRTQLAPEISIAFKAFGAAVFAEGALPRKTKELIAVAAWDPLESTCRHASLSIL